MTNYREILRLHSLGLNKTEIAASCQCARNTVAATLQGAANAQLQWPLPEEMLDKRSQRACSRPLPRSPFTRCRTTPMFTRSSSAAASP